MKETKHIIELTLRVHKSGHITEEEATKGLITICKNSKLFNANSFWWGWLCGGIVTFITYLTTSL